MNETTLSTSRGPVIIRPTREADAAAYRNLRLEALHQHPETYSAEYEANAARPLDDWHAAMQRGSGGPLGITYVAETEGRLVGMAALVRGDTQKRRHGATIYSVYVQPGWRGMGVAEALIQACLSWARAQQLRVVKLSVGTTNASAIRLYLRCGFSVYGVEPESIAWDGTYYDALLLVYRIQPPC